MDENPIAVLWNLENAREIDCPECKKALREIINPYYYGWTLDTATMFVCVQCHLWICGCCGATYTKNGSSYQTPLAKPPEWEAEIEKFKEFVMRGGH